MNGTKISEYVLQGSEAIQIGPAVLVYKPAFQPDELNAPAKRGLPGSHTRKPIVFIPGFMGSQLWQGDKMLWPDLKLLFTHPQALMLPEDPPATIHGLVEELVVVPGLFKLEQYSQFTGFLKESLGYTAHADLIEFAYDWRKDLRQAAQQLKVQVEAFRQTLPDPTTKVILIAHSMGCLVTRYFVDVLGGDQMAEHTLGTRNRNAVRRVAEGRLESERFDFVVGLGTGAVGVDVPDVVRLQTGVAESVAHGTNRAPPLGVRVGHRVSIAGGAVAGELGVDGGAAGFRMLQLFEDQHATAFAQHKTIAVEVERPARLFRCGATGRQCRQQVEPRHAERADHAVRSPGHHHIGIAVADQFSRFTDGLGTGGASRQRGAVRPAQIELVREVSRRGVHLPLGFARAVQQPR